MSQGDLRKDASIELLFLQVVSEREKINHTLKKHAIATFAHIYGTTGWSIAMQKCSVHGEVLNEAMEETDRSDWVFFESNQNKRAGLAKTNEAGQSGRSRGDFFRERRSRN